jgi:hypothetical protein
VPDFRKIWHNQWGLSLYIESQRAGEARTLMLDYGYTAEALINNLEITGAASLRNRTHQRRATRRRRGFPGVQLLAGR